MKLKEIGLAEWKGLVDEYPNATLFHTPEWLRVLKEGFPHIEIKLYAIVNGKNRIIGLLPVELARKGPFKLGGSPLPGLFTPYQGPLLLDSPSIVVEEVLKNVVQVCKPHYLAVSFSPEGSSGMRGSGNPTSWELKKTILLDLALGAEKLWEKLKAETRNQVRQAERRGVEIYTPKSPDEWLEDYCAMHEAVYSRQGMKPPAKPVFYQALWDNLYGKGQLKIILAKHKGKTIAGGIFPVYKKTVYFLDGASFREHQKLRGNNLIQWYVISWAASEGLHVYDMVGANVPSIAHFKRGFGGAEAKFPYFHMTRGFLGKIGYQFYQRYRPLLKRIGI